MGSPICDMVVLFVMFEEGDSCFAEDGGEVVEGGGSVGGGGIGLCVLEELQEEVMLQDGLCKVVFVLQGHGGYCGFCSGLDGYEAVLKRALGFYVYDV